MAAGLVIRHRARAEMGQRPGGGGGDPAVTAAAPGGRRGPRRLGRLGQAPGGAGARARRLFAAARGTRPLRPGATGGADRGGAVQAPVGGRALRPYRAGGDRAPHQPGRVAAPHGMGGPSLTPFDLTGKKAFVTGASRGIGQAIAVALAQAGADVAVVARTEEGLAATAKQIAGCGREAHVIPADVTRPEAAEAATAAA